MTVVMPALQDAVLLIMFAHTCNLPCSHGISVDCDACAAASLAQAKPVDVIPCRICST